MNTIPPLFRYPDEGQIRTSPSTIMKQNIATITGLAMLGMTFQAFAAKHAHANCPECGPTEVEIHKMMGKHGGPHMGMHELKAAKPGHGHGAKVQGLMVGPDGKVKRFGFGGDDAPRPKIKAKIKGRDHEGDDKGIHLEFELDIDGAQVEQFLDRIEARLGDLDLDELIGGIAGQFDEEDIDRMMGHFMKRPDDPDAPGPMRHFMSGVDPEEMGEMPEGAMPPPEVIEELMREFAEQVKPEDVEGLMKGFGFGGQVDPEQMEKMMEHFHKYFGGAIEAPKPPFHHGARPPHGARPHHGVRPPHGARPPHAPGASARRPHPPHSGMHRQAPGPDRREAEIRALRRQLAEQQEMLEDLTQRLEKVIGEQ